MFWIGGRLREVVVHDGHGGFHCKYIFSKRKRSCHVKSNKVPLSKEYINNQTYLGYGDFSHIRTLLFLGDHFDAVAKVKTL